MQPRLPMDTLKGIRVLVVEDHADQRFLARAVLERFGAIVDVVESVDEALLEVDNFVPDLVVSDLALPSRSGLDLIKDLKLHHPDIGIIALTASHDQKMRDRTFEAGAHSFITKPCATPFLVREVKKIASRLSN